MTNAPARNMAEIGDTVSLEGNSFRYTIVDAEDCEFVLRLYKDFAQIRYIGKPCVGYFGHRATVEGIYIKKKGNE